MSSKREEERNEKVIRGLMKLPPNRRCINCNNLGPQYVCTNFWTFICITCSGIHREFTHRVKSVSMAKFTSQEVEALQKGGNQRARETYLVHWDPQMQKQPNSSNAEKVREFIKHVYVDKKYAGNKPSDKPPTGTQNLRHPEEETRRASSYHSYSQSPPYDYQYEERRYGRQLPVLTRKPGSDRGLYEGKVSNFSSPSRFSDQTLEHPPRASDYSVSSPGQSPNFERDGRVRSPPFQTTDNIGKENSERFRRTQRATSSGSFGSFDSNSLSFKSSNSVTLADLVATTDQSSETIQDIQYKQSAEVVIQDKQYHTSSLPPSSTSTNFGGLDLFDTPFAPQNVTPSPTVDLFHLPEAQPKGPIDLFEPSSTSSVPNIHAQIPPETTPSSLNFFSHMPQQSRPETMSKILPDEVVPKNEGWAMFDFPQQATPNPSVGHNAQEPMPIHDFTHEPKSMHNLWHGEPYKAQVSFTSAQVNEAINVHEPTSMHNLWHVEPYKSQVSSTNNQQPWDAFEDPNRQFPYSVTHQSGQEVAGQAPFTTVDQHLGDFNQAGFDRVVLDSRHPIANIPFHVEAQTHVIERKSSNPFDLSDDCDFESSSMYLNMNSLQAALPSGQLPNSFVDDVNQSWFAHNPAPHYIPTAQQAALGYMGGPAPNVQMTNVPNQEPVAPVGGNPFA